MMIRNGDTKGRPVPFAGRRIPIAMNPVTNLVPDSDDLDALAAYVYSLGP